MGLDVGDRRIGVALSDPSGFLAQGLTVVHRKGLTQDLDTLATIITENEVAKVVIGLPRRMDGSLGEQAEKTKYFGEALQQKVAIPIEYWDERLTTSEAEKAMISAGLKRAQRKVSIDMVAATILLQSYLDFCGRNTGNQSAE
jgi:putative Holliday junction resolvase